MKRGTLLLCTVVAVILIAAALILYRVYMGNLNRYEVAQVGYCVCPQDINEVMDSYLKLGPFARSKGALRRRLLALEGIGDVKVRTSPNGLVSVTVVNRDPDCVLVEDAPVPVCWELEKGTLVKAKKAESEYRWRVGITPAYCDNLRVFGADSGLYEILYSLRGLLDNKSLNTIVELDNNMSGNLGWMVITLPDCGALLHVKEPVSVSRLETALKLISERALSGTGRGTWDLYRDVLVMRH